MLRLLFFCILLTTWTIANGQFLYNYDEEDQYNGEPEESPDSALYKYNSPSAVQQYFPDSLRSKPLPKDTTLVQPRPQPARERPLEEPVEPRRYRPDMVAPAVEYQTDTEEDYATEAPRNQQRRRMSRRRESRNRQRVQEVQEVTEAPRYYGPSAFENIRLGQAPDGIYVPEDSLLNILKSDNSRRTQPRQVSQAQYVPESNTLNSNYESNVSPFYGHSSPRQPAAPRPQPQVIPQNNVRHQFYGQTPRNEPAYEPLLRDEAAYEQPPQAQSAYEQASPFYRPSSDEFPEEEYRRQRKVPVEVLPQYVSPRSLPNLRTQSNYRSHRQQARQEMRTSYEDSDSQNAGEIRQPQLVENFENEPRRRPRPVENVENVPRRRPQPVENVENVPRRRQRIQEPVTEAPLKRSRTTFKPAKLAIASLPDDSDGDGIPGEAGFDYPTLHLIPSTSFSCSQQQHNGYYADLETSCQVMHLCQAGGKQSSFLCPNGTIFSQEKFSCQWWYKVNCQNSPKFYSINDQLYKIPEDTRKN